jgi:NADH-quinone oxidoreductase subunit M
MFSHGAIAGLLFAVVGRMVYERTHTRQLAELQKLPLHRLMPFSAVVFVIAGLASMGMPGFSGFPAELTLLIGTSQFSTVWAVCAAFGVLIAAAFTLRAIQVAFFGQASVSAATANGGAHVEHAGPADAAHAHPYAPITWPEKTGALLLLAAIVLIGLKPDLLLNWIVPSLQSPAMRAIWTGGAQ